LFSTITLCARLSENVRAHMPIRPLDRLLFAQGGRCFFCDRPLPKTDASVEHLVALTHGGPDNDENCVACCKQLNSLFGRVSLKEKIRIVLNQGGKFVCPAVVAGTAPAKKATAPKSVAAPPTTTDAKLEVVLLDLHKRGAAKPGTVEKLKNTMKSALKNGETDEELSALVQALEARQFILVAEGKVTYALPPRAL